MKSRWIGCLVLAVGALLSGCSTLPDSRGMAVTVVSVRPMESTLLETSIELTLRLTNEGAAPLALAGSAHRLHLNDSYVGRAVSNQRLVVPPLGTITQTVTAYLENLTLARKFAEFSKMPVIGYRLESEFHPADGSAFGRLRTTAAGELDLNALRSQMANEAPSAPILLNP